MDEVAHALPQVYAVELQGYGVAGVDGVGQLHSHSVGVFG